PTIAEEHVGAGRALARLRKHCLELAQRDPLLLFVSGDWLRLARDLGLELLGRAQHLEPLGVELRRTGGGRLTEPFPVAVLRKHGELRLRGANRKLLAFELDPGGKNGVLKRVLALRQLR